MRTRTRREPIPKDTIHRHPPDTGPAGRSIRYGRNRQRVGPIKRVIINKLIVRRLEDLVPHVSAGGGTGLAPQSQSFSRSYGSNLPTSLNYIRLSTRDSSSRRPDADIGTADAVVSSQLFIQIFPDNRFTSPVFSRTGYGARDVALIATLFGGERAYIWALSPIEPISRNPHDAF